MIKNNVFHSLRRGWGIQVFGGDATERLRVLNNTFAFESPYRDGHIVLASTVVDAVIENNVFYDPRAVAVQYSGGSYVNCVIRRNMIYGGVASAAPPTGMTILDNLDDTDPLLANPTGFDFHLTMASPAVDAGNTLAQVADDFDGTPRPQGGGFDLGAFELGP